jgi:Tfp pilus assembly protein PilO
VCGGWYYFSISGAQAEVESAKRNRDGLKGQLTRYKQQGYGEKVQIKKERKKILIREIKASRDTLPTEDQVADFLLSLKNHADSTGLAIVKLQKMEKVYESQYSMVPIKMEVFGNTVDLVRFFQTLAEPQERMVNIKNLSLRWVNPTTNRAIVTKDSELAESERLVTSAQLQSQHKDLAEKIKRIVELDIEQRLGKISAKFTVNAFTMLTDDERNNIGDLVR